MLVTSLTGPQREETGDDDDDDDSLENPSTIRKVKDQVLKGMGGDVKRGRGWKDKNLQFFSVKNQF